MLLVMLLPVVLGCARDRLLAVPATSLLQWVPVCSVVATSHYLQVPPLPLPVDLLLSAVVKAPPLAAVWLLKVALVQPLEGQLTSLVDRLLSVRRAM